MKRVLFLTTAHRDDDDRIFDHQAKTLLQRGYQVKICSLSSERKGVFDGIEIESYSMLHVSVSDKIRKFQELIASFAPNIIYCSEPLAVVSAKNYQKKTKVSVIYDITEWYPSMRMLAGSKGIGKLFLGVKLFLIQLYAGYLSRAFIFGEKTKRFPLYHFFFWKESLLLPYYPHEQFIVSNVKDAPKDVLTLAYTGNFSEEKGVGRFFEVAACVQRMRPAIEVNILLIGKSFNAQDQKYFEKELRKYHFKNIEIYPTLPLEKFSEALATADICFDLRTLSFENHHCLPIKIFYYAASGKPVIYSKLKAIKTQVDISKFGYLVKPSATNEIAKLVLKYIDDPALYLRHAKGGRRLFEQQYNWSSISSKFVAFTQKYVQ